MKTPTEIWIPLMTMINKIKITKSPTPNPKKKKCPRKKAIIRRNKKILIHRKTKRKKKKKRENKKEIIKQKKQIKNHKTKNQLKNSPRMKYRILESWLGFQGFLYRIKCKLKNRWLNHKRLKRKKHDD